MSPAIPLHAPLLPPGPHPAGASTSGAVFNVATTIIGAGIMSIPATLKVLGVFPAFALIVVVGILADVSAEFLVKFTRPGEAVTYAGVMREYFGPGASTATQICVMITNLGCLIMYLIIIGDVLSGTGSQAYMGVLQEWFGVHWWNAREISILVTVVVVLLPLVLLRRVESLKFSSAVSVLLAVIFVGICSVMAVTAVVQGKSKEPRLVPHLDEETTFFDLFTAVPVIVTAFTFHFNVHPIAVELGKASQMIKATRIALSLSAAIYFAIGIFGYLLFGDAIMPDILVNFHRSSGDATGTVLNDVVRVSYALHLMLVFPLLNFSLRANIDEFLEAENKRFGVITAGLLAFSYTAAILFPNIWYLFQFLGSTSAVCLAFIFPGAIALRDVHGVSKRGEKVVAAMMIVMAVITSAIAISINVYNLFKPNTL